MVQQFSSIKNYVNDKFYVAAYFLFVFLIEMLS